MEIAYYNNLVKKLEGEGCVLRKLVETVLENLSTTEVFLFRVACGSCGTEYGTKPIRFSKSEIPPTTQSKQIIR